MKERNMKLNKFVNLLVIGLVLCVAAPGCRKKPVGVTNLPGAKAGPVGEPGPGPQIGAQPPVSTEPGAGGTGTTGIPQGPGHPNWPENAEILKADTVYFDFDSSVLKTSEKPKVAAVADYLKANSANAVRVEGNCDERGTEEYNRSLGERRALAVREELVRLGLDPTRVDTISYGKDRPVAQGHDESAWKLNRRDDFIVLSPPAK
jgi:peptidoglycan-associated lipoprotein